MIQLYNNAYSVRTEISRAGNRILGDRTGRTITQTTIDGVSRLTKGRFTPSGKLTHLSMFGAVVAISSKNKTIKAVGFVMGGVLLLSYLFGRL